MKNKREVWAAMIIGGYSKTLGITIAEAVERLLQAGSLSYMEECYDTLHLLSNRDVIRELLEMTELEAVK